MPAEQKALREGTRGCLDAITIDTAICMEAKVCSQEIWPKGNPNDNSNSHPLSPVAF